MWVYDLETRRFLAANGAAILSYGYSNEEFLAMTIEDLRAPETAAAVDQLPSMAPVVQNPRIWKHRKKDGTNILVEVTAHDVTIDGHTGRLVLANNVTARLRAESDLRESEARNRAILNSALSAVVVIDAAGEVLEWNPRAEAMFGWARDEVRGRELSVMIIPPKYRELHRRGLRRFLATGESNVLNRLIEMSALRRDGSEFPIELSISPLKAGETVTFCGFVTDITERRKAEAEIQQLNEELERRIQQRTGELEAANKELESFSYSVSHDLRAPLRHVQGYVALLQRATEGQLSDKAQRHVKIINDASVEMGQLIDDLLEFSRMGRTEMREGRVMLDALVRSSIDRLEVVVRGRNIVWNIGPLPMVIGDASMIRQVLGNLIGNAIKYTRQRETAEIEIGTAGEEEGRAVVFVRDNGAGFDMNYVHKLFGVFQRLHRADEFEGTGIGLATVRRVVSRHGGRVWAEGAVGSGATFYFTIRRATDESGQRVPILS
jgi:PAS domain S-box-containing protein